MELIREGETSFRSSAAQPGPMGLIREASAEIWSRRRLIRYLVQADLKKKGADTLLGNIWWVVDPLLQMAVYVVLVTIIFNRRIPDYPLFIFAAILPWKWFQSTVQDSVNSVVSSDRLIKQIHFPKIVLPIAAQVAAISNFAFGLIPLVTLEVLLYRDRLSLWLIAIPLVAVVQLVFTSSIGTVLSAINVFYRDVGNVTRHVLRLWFYLSPALWSFETLTSFSDHPDLDRLAHLNPFAVLLESYRRVIYYETAPDWAGLATLLLVSIGLVAVSFVLFKRVEPSFAKVL
jgi:lipopolysaccharide transport system permease protein/teichoic acid transport system permease protein